MSDVNGSENATAEDQDDLVQGVEDADQAAEADDEGDGGDSND